MIQLLQLSFAYHESFLIFNKLDLRLAPKRTGLVGPNACGKSTLLALIAGELAPTAGVVRADLSIYYVPQWTEGDQSQRGSPGHEKHLRNWSVDHLDFAEAQTFSGGTWQRLRLATAFAHEDHFLLLDEPSNHLDRSGRQQLIRAIERHRGGILIASHDRQLLAVMEQIIELQPEGPRLFGGGYDFYKAARDQEQASFQAAWDQQKQELGKARKEAQKTREKQEKKSAKGRRERLDIDIRAARGLKRMQAEHTSAKLQAKHEDKVADAEKELRKKAERLIEPVSLHFDLKAQRRAGDRPVLSLEGVQHGWDGQKLWTEPLHLQLNAGEHVALCGDNGAGKSTLLRLIMGAIEPQEGRIHRRFREAFLLDQDLSSLPLQKSLLDIWDDPLYLPDQGMRRTIAARLGLKAREATVPLAELSGGQRLRAALVLLATRAVPVELILLDEPSNHLDLAAVECLVTTLKALPASLVVVSHDPVFLQDLGIEHGLELARRP